MHAQPTTRRKALHKKKHTKAVTIFHSLQWKTYKNSERELLLKNLIRCYCFLFSFFFNYGRFSTHVWAWRNCCCWVCHHGCSVTSGFRWLISRCKQPGFACCLGASYVIVSRDYLGDPISLLELRETLRPGEIDTNLHRKTGSRFGSPHIFAVAEPPKISAYSQRPKVASYRIKNIFWSKPR